jgi:hypothetical protein
MPDLPAAFRETHFWTDAATPVPERFIVVTAHNPDGVITPPGANEAADLRLQEELTREGLPFFRVTGGARDRSHLEPGWGIAVEAPEPLGPRLSIDYRQLAFFWVTGGEIWLVDTATGQRHFVAVWRDRAMP